MEPFLGIYVHMHWGYNHPYAARTWTLADWKGYLEGLSRLGYNLVQIWPMIDTMPSPPTQSDRMHLDKLARVIDMAKGQYGMRAVVGASANAMGNASAADYPFERRPYFRAERLIDPSKPSDVAELMAARRELLAPLAQADGMWILDSDPGWYEGSPDSEFVMLMLEHRKLLDELRPGIELVYWMWSGWEEHSFDPHWSANPQDTWRRCLVGLRQASPEPWRVNACWPGHFAALAELDLADKALFFPYNAVEFEPSLPLTNWDPTPQGHLARAFESVSGYRYPVGAMGNSQSHCLQLPHLYLFKHLAEGGTAETADLASFARRLYPEAGDRVAAAWKALGGADPSLMDRLATEMEELAQEPSDTGELEGLLFGDAQRLLRDLPPQLRLAAAMRRVPQAEGEAGRKEALGAVADALAAWQSVHGFADRPWGRFMDVARVCLAPYVPDLLDEAHKGDRHGSTLRVLQAIRRAGG